MEKNQISLFSNLLNEKQEVLSQLAFFPSAWK